MIYLFYNILLAIAAVFLVPFYGFKILSTGKYKKSIGAKLGFVNREELKNLSGSPRVWIHAVSVGEVTAAAPIISELNKLWVHPCIIVSTSTETGQEMARKIIPEASAWIYFPLDIPGVVNKMLDLLRPDLFVAVETEIWPNFIRSCKNKGIKVLILNGRISPRSFKRYFKTNFFWKNVLENIDAAGVISDTDAQRIKAIGMDSHKVWVIGNSKYDSLASRASDETLRDQIAKKLGIQPGSKVLVAGSTHFNEESIILDVYSKLLKKYPDILLILVPRHIERAREVMSLIEQAGFRDIIAASEINSGRKRAAERIILIDVIGELFKTYSLATIVYCGGSLVPRGGQNILEAAAWGKVVLYGPHMEDFQDEKLLLENSGAGIMIKSGDELLSKIHELLDNAALLGRKEACGKQMVVSNRGASKKYADMILRALG